MQKIDIVNLALARLGEPAISDMQEGSEEAAKVYAVWDSALDATLQAYRWEFNTTRQTLALVEEGPAGYAYRFKYGCPNNMLQPYEIFNPIEGGHIIPFITEGGYIYTDQENAVLVYAVRVYECDMFTPAFVEALSWRLVGDLAIALTQDSRLAGWAQQNFDKAIDSAKALAGNSRSPKRTVGVYARYAGRDSYGAMALSAYSDSPSGGPAAPADVSDIAQQAVEAAMQADGYAQSASASAGMAQHYMEAAGAVLSSVRGEANTAVSSIQAAAKAAMSSVEDLSGKASASAARAASDAERACSCADRAEAAADTVEDAMWTVETSSRAAAASAADAAAAMRDASGFADAASAQASSASASVSAAEESARDAARSAQAAQDGVQGFDSVVQAGVNRVQGAVSDKMTLLDNKAASASESASRATTAADRAEQSAEIAGTVITNATVTKITSIEGDGMVELLTASDIPSEFIIGIRKVSGPVVAAIDSTGIELINARFRAGNYSKFYIKNGNEEGNSRPYTWYTSVECSSSGSIKMEPNIDGVTHYSPSGSMKFMGDTGTFSIVTNDGAYRIEGEVYKEAGVNLFSSVTISSNESRLEITRWTAGGITTETIEM